MPISDVRAAESAGEFVSQRAVRIVLREFPVVIAIVFELREVVGLKGTHEEKEIGH